MNEKIIRIVCKEEAMNADEFREKRNARMLKILWWGIFVPIAAIGIYAVLRSVWPTFRLPFLP